MSMNGYDLSHKFFEWAFNNREDFKPAVSALYFYLVEICNTLGWKKEFSISAKECMEGMGVSGYNTYKSAFDVLCKHGFIKVVKKSCNHYQANVITLLNFDRVTDKVTNKVIDELTNEVDVYPIKIEQGNNKGNYQGNYQSNGDIHKTTNNKTIKTIKQEIIPETEVSVKSNKKQKIKFSEFVSLTQEEYNKLIQEHSESATKRMIEILNNYKGSSGKKYKSDYLAILNWVVNRYSDEKNKSSQSRTMSFENGNKRRILDPSQTHYDESLNDSDGYMDTL